MRDRVNGFTDAELAAAAVGWRIAHDDICPMGPVCSRHQPINAEAQKRRLVAELLADPDYIKVKRKP